MDNHDIDFVGAEFELVAAEGMGKTELHVLHVLGGDAVNGEQIVELESNAAEQLEGIRVGDGINGRELVVNGLAKLLILNG